MCTFTSFRCIHCICSCYLLISKSWWRLLKPKRLTWDIHHNKMTYLDYSVFLLSPYIYIYIYKSDKNVYMYTYIGFFANQTHWSLERSRLGISFHELIRNEIIQEQRGVNDVIMELDRTRPKIHRQQVDPWSCRVVSKRPKTTHERPPRRWEYEIVKRFVRTWRTRTKWKCIVASDVENIKQFGQFRE